MPNKIKAAGWHHAASKDIQKINPNKLVTSGQSDKSKQIFNQNSPNPYDYYSKEFSGLLPTNSDGWAMGRQQTLIN